MRRRSFAREREHVCPPFGGGVVGRAIHASLKAWKGDECIRRLEERRDAEIVRRGARKRTVWMDERVVQGYGPRCCKTSDCRLEGNNHPREGGIRTKMGMSRSNETKSFHCTSRIEWRGATSTTRRCRIIKFKPSPLCVQVSRIVSALFLRSKPVRGYVSCSSTVALDAMHVRFVSEMSPLPFLQVEIHRFRETNASNSWRAQTRGGS